jgi:hypothetical protein
MPGSGILPFTAQEFFEVFRRYNEAIWPLQVVLNALAIGALALVLRPRRHSGRVISGSLALLWTWVAVVYQFGFFRPINPAAGLFGALFLLGAAAFAWEGMVRGRLRFECGATARCAAGFALAAYALLAYPVLSYLAGREASEIASFGLPCPTTIFTIAMLAFLKAPYPRWVFVAPLLWALIGGQAAWLLGVYEDFGLLVAGIAGAWFALRARGRRLATWRDVRAMLKQPE